MEQSERPASEIAMQLGIRRNQLYKWKDQMKKTGDVAAAKKGPPMKSDPICSLFIRDQILLLSNEFQPTLPLRLAADTVPPLICAIY